MDLGPAARRLAALVSRVADDELGRPTPCPAYTLGDLIDHVGGLALAFTAAAEKDTGRYGDQGPQEMSPRLGPDWRIRIPRDLETLAGAWRQPQAWTGRTRIAGMDAPAEIIGLSAADELAVHGWDLAQASGQPYACQPELLEAARSFLVQFASPDAPAGPTVPFGPARQLPDGAPLLDSGRDLSLVPGEILRVLLAGHIRWRPAPRLAED